MRKNRWIGLILAAALVLAAGCASAMDEMAALLEAGERLLLDTENVTIAGNAEFFLDGESFKTATGLYIQDGTDAYQQIDLAGKDTEGEMRETGYAVVDLNGEVLSSEMYHGKDHRKDRMHAPARTILEETRRVTQLRLFCAVAAEALDANLGEKLHKEMTDNETSIWFSVEEADIPPAFQAALNFLWQEGVSRFYFRDYGDMMPEPYATVEQYGTPTEGILFTTREIALTRLQIEAELDEYDRIAAFRGEADLRLMSGGSGDRLLTVGFSMRAEDYGTSEVRQNEAVLTRMGDLSELIERAGEKPFEEDNWLDTDYDFAAGLTVPQKPKFESRLTPRAVETEADVLAYAKEVWAMDILDTGAVADIEWYATAMNNGHWLVEGVNPDPACLMEIGRDGWIYRLQNQASGVGGALYFWSDTLSGDGWNDFRGELISLSLDIAEGINPGNAEKMAHIRETSDIEHGMYNPGYSGEMTDGGSVYMAFHSDPLDPDRQSRIKWVYQIAPTVCLVEYDETIDPQEGGNG